MMSKGLQFDENNKGELLLGMENAHSHKRIVHSQSGVEMRRKNECNQIEVNA